MAVTQALVTTTLGGGQDEQRIESFMDEDEENRTFMLHYNFPPFSVGEVKGHYVHLAVAKWDMDIWQHPHFAICLPDKESFPYTIRISCRYFRI